MRYFDNLETITYNDLYTCKDFFTRVVLEYLNEDYITYYKIEKYEKIENISFKLYGTVDYWWILCIINNINDMIYDLPLSDATIDKFVETFEGTMEERIAYQEFLVKEQDKKRVIKVIKKEFISKIITDILRNINTWR